MANYDTDTIIYHITECDDYKNKSIIFNLFTGAIGVIDRDLLSKNNSNDPQMIPTVLIRYFVSDEESTDYDYIYECIFNSVKKILHPEIVYVPWFECDLACTYCWQRQQKLKQMNSETIGHLSRAIDNSIDYFAKSGWKKKPHMNIFGGEPLLESENRKNEIIRAVKLANSRGLTCHITTSGVHLSKYLNELYRLGVHGFQITIDGPRDIHDNRRPMQNGNGTFDAICHGVSSALEYGFNISIRVNVDSENINSLPLLMTFFFEKGWINNMKFKVYLSPVTDHICHSKASGIIQSDLERILSLLSETPGMTHYSLNYWRGADVISKIVNHQYLELPRFHYCEASYGAQLVLSPDGSIHPCLESLGHSKMAVGRWDPKFFINEECFNPWKAKVTELENCQACKVRFLCGGGCTFARLNRHKDKEIYCERVFEQVEQSLDHFWPYILHIIK